MHLRKFFNKLQLTSAIQQKIRLVHTYIYKMNKAYLRSSEDSEVFELSFQYSNSELNINRQFNFTRKLDENVSSFTSRISKNIERVMIKKQKKKKNEQVDSNQKTEVSLLENGAEISGDVLCKDLFSLTRNIELRLVDQVYEIVINSPWIKNLSLPSSILANFPIYPSKFDTVSVDRNLSSFTWSKSIDKKTWTIVGSKFLYFPQKDDIDNFLKFNCQPRNATGSGPETEVESNEKVQANPGLCPFQTRHKFTEEKLSGEKVMTYNILADLYCDSMYSRCVLYSHCPSYALNFDYRKQLIMNELLGFNADIICLQEVDEKLFENDLKLILPSLNFEGVYSKKGGVMTEGLSCLYNLTRFKCLDNFYRILGEGLDKNPVFSEIWSKIETNDNLVKRLTELKTILQVTVLESYENDEILIVGNTHFYFHPEADHIRLLQAEISRIHLDQIIKQWIDVCAPNKRVSLIFCGDFNSVPECGMYQLYTTGFVPENFKDWNSTEDEAVQGLSLNNSRLLTSACGTPKYTNFTIGFQDCLDYIFYENDHFKVTQVVPLPSLEELTEHTALPSVLMPSDHISLVVDLQWLPKKL